jgi:hypothetical protein
VRRADPSSRGVLPSVYVSGATITPTMSGLKRPENASLVGHSVRGVCGTVIGQAMAVG